MIVSGVLNIFNSHALSPFDEISNLPHTLARAGDNGRKGERRSMYKSYIKFNTLMNIIFLE